MTIDNVFGQSQRSLRRQQPVQSASFTAAAQVQSDTLAQEASRSNRPAFTPRIAVDPHQTIESYAKLIVDQFGEKEPQKVEDREGEAITSALQMRLKGKISKKDPLPRVTRGGGLFSPRSQIKVGNLTLEGSPDNLAAGIRNIYRLMDPPADADPLVKKAAPRMRDVLLDKPRKIFFRTAGKPLPRESVLDAFVTISKVGDYFIKDQKTEKESVEFYWDARIKDLGLFRFMIDSALDIDARPDGATYSGGREGEIRLYPGAVKPDGSFRSGIIPHYDMMRAERYGEAIAESFSADINSHLTIVERRVDDPTVPDEQGRFNFGATDYSIKIGSIIVRTTDPAYRSDRTDYQTFGFEAATFMSGVLESLANIAVSGTDDQKAELERMLVSPEVVYIERADQTRPSEDVDNAVWREVGDEPGREVRLAKRGNENYRFTPDRLLSLLGREVAPPATLIANLGIDDSDPTGLPPVYGMETETTARPPEYIPYDAVPPEGSPPSDQGTRTSSSNP